MDDMISRKDAIDALKICDNNEDGINCHKCPLRDERWDGAWENDETTCYRKLMRDSAKLLESPPIEPETSILTVTVAPNPEEIERVVRKIKDAPVTVLPSVQPEYEPVTAEDFAKTMSENTLYSFIAWHNEAVGLMERQGFVICKKTIL